MAHYRGTIDSKRSVEATFDYMADFRSVAAWDPTAVEAEMLGDAPGIGTRFRVVVRIAGRENEFIYTTLEYERPRRFVLRAESSTVVSQDTVTVEAAPGAGAKLIYDADLRPKGLIKLADPVLGLMFKRLGDNAAAGLRRELGSSEALSDEDVSSDGRD